MEEQVKDQNGATQVTGEIIDIEQFAQSGKRPPKGCRYRVRIDKERFVFDVSLVTGRDVLLKAGKNPPEQYMLLQKVHGGQMVRIELNQTVDLSTPGVEKFVTLPLDQQEG